MTGATRSPLKQSKAANDEPASGASEAQGTLTDWPRDHDGRPMVQITAAAREIIGLRDHSNVMVGPSSWTMFVPQGQDEIPDAELEALVKVTNQLHEKLEERVIAEQREVVLDTVDPAKRHDS